MTRQPKSFRLQGKSIFLTYPKCDLIALYIIDQLYNILSKFKPTYARVAQEHHKDGTLHLHCLVQTEKKFDISDKRFFDIEDPGTLRNYHPNCQVPRRDSDVADYIAKGGVFEERGILKCSQKSSSKSRDDKWLSLISESSSQSEFLSRVKSEQPYVYATQLRNLEYMAAKQWPIEPVNYKPQWTTFLNIPPALTHWANENIFVVHRTMLNLFSIHTTFDLELAQEHTLEHIENRWADILEHAHVFDIGSGDEAPSAQDDDN